ncbi:MAG TPA: FG-GAP-like repeat-containing protein [Candidatus Sulfotelmatobacter sp.]|nr:FG-GAP-like repeat-containing protein [Candidatus Sulfotelmatobacter sp.]
MSPLWGQFLETRGSAAVLSSPYSIASGDFNGDGKLDLAVTAFYNGKVAVLLGRGDGTFGPAVYYSVGGNETANAIFVVDLRGIGTLDLVVTNSLNHEIEVLLGNGDGTFGVPAPFNTVANPFYIAAGDFTNNGHPGVVALTYGTSKCDCLVVLPGNGDGTLGSPIFTYGVGGTTALVAGRFTASANLDVAVSLETGLNIYLGQGNGTFQLGNSYPISSAPGAITAASFRKNNILDLALTLPFAGGIAIYLGNGDGTFTEGEIVPGGFADPVIAGDINGDGYPDLLALTGYPNTYLTTYLGNGDGTFQAGISYPLSGGPSNIGVGDFNGDHKQDVAVADYSGNAMVTMLNTGTVSLSPTTPLTFKKQAVGTTSAPQTVTLTNTGKTELKISSMKSTGQFGMSSTCGASVATGANCTISVTFSPKTQGAKSGTVTINDSASSKPQVIELSGTGT